MTVTCTETAECDKWAEIVALAQQGNKKMLGVILQAFDIKLRKIAHTSAYKGFAEDGEQIERVAVVKALEKWGPRQDFEKLPAFIVSKSYTALSSEWKRRHKDEEMTCPYEIESGCEFAEEVLTADAAQTTRTYFEQQQLQQDFAEVQELLVQLSPKQEELIELHFLEGWSNGELAQRFGVSPAAISKTIKKGLTKLAAAAACSASGRKTAGSGRTADVDKLGYGSSGAGRAGCYGTVSQGDLTGKRLPPPGQRTP